MTSLTHPAWGRGNRYGRRRVWSFTDTEDERRDKEIVIPRRYGYQPQRRSDKPPNHLSKDDRKPRYQPPDDTTDHAKRTNKDEPVADVNATGKNVTVHLDVNVQIDLTDDVAELARLNRLGWFRQGVTLYEEKLQNHKDFFPVAAEYADLLLQQGNYGAVSKFISDCPLMVFQGKSAGQKNYAPDEEMVLKAIKAYADILCQGNLSTAIDAAIEMSDFLKRESVDSLKGTKIHMVELHIQIINFIGFSSNFLSKYRARNMRRIHFHRYSWNIFPQEALSWYDFGTWHYTYTLSQNGLYWEAFRFLRLILSILEEGRGNHASPDEVVPVFKELMQIRRVADLTKSFMALDHISSDGDEQLVLAELASALVIENFLTTVLPEYRDVARECLDRERSLVTLILDKYPHLSTSRPFLEWILREQVRSLSIRVPATSQLVDWLPSLTHKGHIIKLPLERYLNIGLIDKGKSRENSNRQQFANIQKLLRTAEELGDFLLQRTLLRDLVYLSGDSALESVENLADLQLNTVIDLVGYIECLVDKYLVIEGILSEEALDVQAKAKAKLCEEIRSFDRLYPPHNDMKHFFRFGKPFLFNIPLSEYLKKQLYIRLLSDLHCDKERLVAEAQLKDIEYELPSYVERSLIKDEHSDTWSESERSSVDIVIDLTEGKKPRPAQTGYHDDFGRRSISPLNRQGTRQSYSRGCERDDDIFNAESDYSGYEEFDVIKEPRGRWSSPSPARRSRRSPIDKVTTTKEYSRAGTTRIPKSLLHVPTLQSLGYPYTEENDVVVIQRALSNPQIDQIIRLPYPNSREWLEGPEYMVIVDNVDSDGVLVEVLDKRKYEPVHQTLRTRSPEKKSVVSPPRFAPYSTSSNSPLSNSPKSREERATKYAGEVSDAAETVKSPAIEDQEHKHSSDALNDDIIQEQKLKRQPTVEVADERASLDRGSI
ncbi:Sodium channel protein type 4 subunit alpha [Talaromyces islandicus]|uniref:Sodium channel protein type 4 subunit alpha n=1 Tax=Talaromyces islandicus TaxID=28573 RepID=A0A0U1M307_TALIS|nr:Sodium channel protein type 4 subunit alpha [Talaromyces islandicus]